MRLTLFHTLAFLLLLTRCESGEEVVEIPDPAFLAVLVEQGVDSNGDGLISLAEAAAVSSLRVRAGHIRELYRGRNDLTTLVLTGNPRLEKLACNNNLLGILNLDDNTALTVMISCGNRLQIILHFL